MFSYPRRQHEQILQRGASIPPSMAQSLTDFSAAIPVSGLDPLQTSPNSFGNFVRLNELALNNQVGEGQGHQNWRTLSKLRKREREEEGEEEVTATTSPNRDFPRMGTRQGVLTSAPNNTPSRAGRLPSLHFPEDPDSDLFTRMQKDLLELDLFISVQMERVRAEAEERRRRQLAGVVRAAEDGVRRVLRAKDEEIASVTRRNSALEEHINMLTLEGQMWKTLARSNEAAAAALRRELELAQQAAGGGGGDASRDGGEAEDSVSCFEGRGGEEEKECGGSRRRCRVCRRDEVCRLVLPCRHLCLCGECESVTDSCPLCGCRKTASIKVFLS